MRRVSRRFGRAATLLALLTVLSANGAFAAPRNDGDGGWLGRFHRFAHLIVTTLADQLGGPPG